LILSIDGDRNQIDEEIGIDGMIRGRYWQPLKMDSLCRLRHPEPSRNNELNRLNSNHDAINSEVVIRDVPSDAPKGTLDEFLSMQI
jgi:hypothetical protein